MATFILLTATFGLLSYFSEPRYQGRKLTDWLMDYHISTYKGNQRNAAPAEEALRAIGTNAIPTLVNMLFPEERTWSLARLFAAAKVPLDLVEDDLARASYYPIALEGFRLFGASASNALPLLLPKLGDSRSAYQVTEAIALIGEPAIRPVTELLVSTNADARRNSVHVLFALTRHELTTVSNLLSHPDPVIRGEAYLWIVGRQIPTEVRQNMIFNGLNDPDPYVSSRAAMVIRNLGSDATNYLNRLQELSVTTNTVLGLEVVATIKQIEKRQRIEQSNPRPRRGRD